jgi:hypothetical protein
MGLESVPNARFQTWLPLSLFAAVMKNKPFLLYPDGPGAKPAIMERISTSQSKLG